MGNNVTWSYPVISEYVTKTVLHNKHGKTFAFERIAAIGLFKDLHGNESKQENSLSQFI